MLVKELAHRNLFLQHVGRDLEPLSSRNGKRVLDLRLGRWPQVIVQVHVNDRTDSLRNPIGESLKLDRIRSRTLLPTSPRFQ